jgi:HK97 family phage major capsid protein/HK97 family phage prohead protease
VAVEIQTVVFNRSKSPAATNGGNGWTASLASDWLKAHDLKAPKVEETPNSLRFRQFSPDRCQLGSYRSLTQNMPVGIIMISCQTSKSTEAEEKAMTTVNRTAVTNARARISAGDVSSGAWSFSASDGNSMLGAAGDDWATYSKWHLGVNSDQSANTKAYYGYPLGKGGKVYRSALTAIRQRAAQQNETDIFDAAGRLIDEIDNPKSLAYSTFEVKSVDEEQRIIEGMATTPTTDRVGDIVEPMGASYKLPLPLLWQHDSRSPVGHVLQAKKSKDGIYIKAQMVKVPEAGVLRDRLDEAWQSIKYGLVRGLSIGFRPVKSEPIPDSEQFGMRFLSWDWLELSAVTIPANIEANIATIKSYDQQALSAAIRVTKTPQVNLSKSTPGASGSTSRKGTDMRTIKEQIGAFEARRLSNSTEMQEIVKDSGERGETMTDEEQQKFDALMAEVEQIDGHVKRLKAADAMNMSQATAVDSNAGSAGADGASGRSPAMSGIRVEAKLEPGVKFARMAMCLARAKMDNMGATPEAYYRADRRWMDTAPDVAMALKTAVPAGDTTTSGWASEWAYAQNIASEFIEYLRPKTLIGRIPGWRNVPFNIRVGSATGGSTGYWVGQGAPVPVSKMTSSSTSLGIAKVAGIVAIDKELARLSTPSAEMMVRNDLTRELQKTLDSDLIDPNNGGQTNIQPASLTYGLTPVTPTGTTYATFVADWKTLTATAIAAELPMSQAVVVMSESTAQALSMMVTSLGNPQFPGLTMTGGSLNGLPVFTTTLATISGSPQFSNIIVLIFPGEVFLADDGQATVEANDQVAIQLLDNPTNASTSGTTATTMVSMWQTESIAVKAVRYINWSKARSQCCAFLQAAAYA